MSHFLKIIKQAKVTCDIKNSASFKTNFIILRQMIDRLTVADLTINPSLLMPEHFNRPNKAPCTYVQLYEHDDFSVGIFILAGSYTMPIHDHPMIYGILKAISGTVRVQSYTAKDPPEIDAYSSAPIIPPMLGTMVAVRRDNPKQLNIETESAILTPTECNFHEITAIGGPAAFFDLLNPPYISKQHGRRKCSFYSLLNENLENCNDTENIYLQSIPCPRHYYTDCPTDFEGEATN